MTEFQDQHDALQQELLEYFRGVLGESLVVPMSKKLEDAATAAIQKLDQRSLEVDTALKTRLEGLEKTLKDLADQRAALAEATQTQAGALADEGLRRIRKELDSVVAAAVSEAAAATLGKRTPTPVIGKSGDRPIDRVRGAPSQRDPKSWQRVSINFLLAAGIFLIGWSAAVVMRPALTPSLALHPAVHAVEPAPPPRAAALHETPEVVRGWRWLRGHSEGLCEGTTTDNCTFAAALLHADLERRGEILQTALTRLTERAKHNVPACRDAHATIVSPWSTTSPGQLTDLGRCLSEPRPPTIEGDNPTSDELAALTRWALAQLDTVTHTE